MDYEMKTTFWMDFSIADNFGAYAIKETYKMAMLWKHDYIFMTELNLVLNWKIWQHYREGNETLSQIYDELWKQHRDWCFENLKDEELTYFIRTTD